MVGVPPPSPLGSKAHTMNTSTTTSSNACNTARAEKRAARGFLGPVDAPLPPPLGPEAHAMSCTHTARSVYGRTFGSPAGTSSSPSPTGTT